MKSVEGMVNMAAAAGSGISVAPNAGVKQAEGAAQGAPAEGGEEFDYSDFDLYE
jgi:hypothetical protein